MQKNCHLYKSTNGITIRKDAEAMFGFLPKEGFAFFAPANDFDILKECLASPKDASLPEGYERIASQQSLPFVFGVPHSLGTARWKTIPVVDTPLIINWMITGSCNFKCIYCYAQDLMHNNVKEPSSIQDIVQSIQKYSPVCVVLTGGEPTFSKFFMEAVNLLSMFTSVVVDTNATMLTNEHIELFKNKNVHVRISIDSHRPQINKKTRIQIDKKFYFNEIDKIFSNISKMNDYNIPITINTVASTKNYDEIESLEKVIRNFKIVKMRIRIVENSKCIHDYLNIAGNETRKKRFLKNIAKNISKHMDIPVYYSASRIRNSVVIVSSDGKFYTESILIDQGKIVIDDVNPCTPRLEYMMKYVDMHAHASRYLLV